MENYIEQCKVVRRLTLAPMNKISAAVQETKGDIDAAVALLVKQNAADVNDMASRATNTNVVYSYVHNNKVGAMIVIACQTDFVAKHLLFQVLAKDICMHIVSNPIAPQFIDKNAIDPREWQGMVNTHRLACQGKPPQIIEKIVEGKMQKYYSEVCLLDQKFIKDDKMTVKQLIESVSAKMGEKIELKRFIKMSSGEIPQCREDGKH
jgi:elongation factor Ts